MMKRLLAISFLLSLMLLSASISFAASRIQTNKGNLQSPPEIITAPVTVVNTTQETTIAETVIPYGLLNAGSIFEGNTLGYFTTKTGAAGTLTFRHKTNGVTTATRELDLGTGLGSAYGWYLHSFRTVRSAGMAGSIVGESILTIDGKDPIISPSATVNAINTTQDMIVSITIQFSVADPENSITVEQGYIAKR